jgi:competence protein ComEC
VSTSTRLAIAAVVSWLGALVACGTPTPTVPSAATVSAARTQVTEIQSGAATPGSTAQAIATRIAPTLQVVQQTVGPIATSIARSTVQITSVNVDATDITIGVHNSASAPASLEGWTLLLGPNIALTLPPISLAPGQTRTLHLGAGTDTESDVYLNTGSVGGVSITFSPGQRAVLVAPGDQVASVFVNI